MVTELRFVISPVAWARILLGILGFSFNLQQSPQLSLLLLWKLFEQRLELVVLYVVAPKRGHDSLGNALVTLLLLLVDQVGVRIH